jgi:hypothetical protein
VTTAQIGGLVAHISDDGVAQLFDLDAHRRLKICGGGVVRAVRHHEESGVVSETRLAQIALCRGALRFRTPSDEEHSDVGSACRAEYLQRGLDRRIARKLIPSSPTAGCARTRVAWPLDRPAEVIQLDDLPVRQRCLVNVEYQRGPVSASGAFGYPTRCLIGNYRQVAIIGAGIVIGTRRDPGITDIGWLRGNGDKRGVFRRGTGCEQRKYEQDEAGKRHVVSERSRGSVIYRRIELWLGNWLRFTQN